MTPQRILIRGNNWLGDVVMSFPLLEALHRHFPLAHMDVLSRGKVAEIYRLLPYIGKVHVSDDTTDKGGRNSVFRQASLLKKSGYDACIALPRSFASSVVPFLARIPMRIGFRGEGRSLLLTHPVRRERALLSTHRTRYFMHLLSPFAPPPEPVMPSIALDPALERWAEDHLRTLGIEKNNPVIGFNPGATYGTAKQWGRERFVRVAKDLIEKYHARVIFFGSPAEHALCELTRKHVGEGSTNLAGKTTLLQLAALIRRCKLFVTNDTGPMHVAALMGVPVVAVFGSTDPVTTAPFTRDWTMVHHKVECSPCLLRTCPIDHRCMTRVPVSDVTRAAEPWLKKTASAPRSLGGAKTR